VNVILVIIDRYTKYSMFFPIATIITSVDLAELFYNEVELRFGIPNGIVYKLVLVGSLLPKLG
jgi:hypothetical protein